MAKTTGAAAVYDGNVSLVNYGCKLQVKNIY